MTKQSNSQRIENKDAARDELVDLGLQELSGKSAPPDLTQQIIAVATQSASSADAQSATASSVRPRSHARHYAREVLCACTLLAVAIGGYFLGGGAGQLQLLAMNDDATSSTRDSGAGDRDTSWLDATSKFGLANEEVDMPRLYEALDGAAPLTASSLNSDDDLDGDTIYGRNPGRDFYDLAGNSGSGGYGSNTDFDQGASQQSASKGEDGDRSGGGGTGGGQIGNSPGNLGIVLSQTQDVGNSSHGETTVHPVKDLVVPRNGIPDSFSGYTLPVPPPTNRLLADVDDGQGEFGEQKLKGFDGPEQFEERNLSGDRYRSIQENRFLDVRLSPLSTFSIDVDTASYSKVRRMILQQGVLPPPDAVRIEEFVNYFSYDYPRPVGKDAAPFAVNTELAACPWQPNHYLMRVALAGKHIDQHARPNSNLVFLLDVSGSMSSHDKLPLVKAGLRQLVERLGENDRVAIVVYAGASGQVLPSTNGTEKAKILSAIEDLSSGGSTNGAAGIELAYQLAEENFIADGVNRVILCTDGDFNVGVSDDGGLVRLVEKKAESGVFLTALGFGMGNHNDSMMEQIADRGNGSYAYIDSRNESYKVFAQQMSGTLVTIAKDVKIQVEFNPAHVAGYRLVGYENRMLATEDFADDKKDAGEIGAGHTVTALYEIVPAGAQVEHDSGLKYQRRNTLTEAGQGVEFANVALRYKEPDADVSKLLEVALSDPRMPAEEQVADGDPTNGETSDGDEPNNAQRSPMPQGTDEFQFAAAVASFAMILRHSAYQGETSFDAVLEIARGAGPDEFGYRAEFLQIVQEAKRIAQANQRP